MSSDSLTLNQTVFDLKKRVRFLEDELDNLKNEIRKSLQIKSYHLMRIKNGEELSDEFILGSLPYLDLSPEKAFELYNDEDRDFILLDVSDASHKPQEEFPEVRKIPYNLIEMNLSQLSNRSTTIFVISEDGIKSILACKKLNKLGFYNLSNISGGYAYWPGFTRLSHPKEIQNINKSA
jgi:rhodanese-related sulfurtransferase